MATPPTLVDEAEGVWSHTGTSETIPGVDTGAVANRALAILAASADSPQTISSPTGGSLTYTLQNSNVISSNCNTYIWTAIPTTQQTFSLGLTGSSNGNMWSANVLTWSGSDGVGASTKNNGTDGPTLNITTTADNSAIAVIVADWNAVDGATRTWRTVNGIAPTAANGHEKTYFRDASNYTVFGAVYPDAGAAGVKTVGLSAPSTGVKYTIIAVEIKGTASGASPQTIAANLLSVSSTIFSPSVAQLIAAQLIATTSILFSPSIEYQIVSPTLSVPSTILTPSVTGGGISVMTGSIADMSRSEMLTALGLTVEQGKSKSNVDLMKEVVDAGGLGIVTVTEATFGVHYWQHLEDLRD